MNRLPATFVEAAEADALAVAREWIARMREPDGIFHPNATVVWGTSMMKWYAQSHPFGADEIMYYAEHGSKEADLVLRQLIAEHVDRGEPLTAVLAAYNIRILNPSSQARKHGAGRAENFLRDVGVWFLVEALITNCGLRPTQHWKRKAKFRPPSASSIAAAALTEAGMNMPQGRRENLGPVSTGVCW